MPLLRDLVLTKHHGKRSGTQQHLKARIFLVPVQLSCSTGKANYWLLLTKLIILGQRNSQIEKDKQEQQKWLRYFIDLFNMGLIRSRSQLFQVDFVPIDKFSLQLSDKSTHAHTRYSRDPNSPIYQFSLSSFHSRFKACMPSYNDEP